MSLFELQAWLGHSSSSCTQRYARITPITLIKAYTDAGYFARNVRAIEGLLDRDAIHTGAAGGGNPFGVYDLGHGYCTYSFFEQCPHRMACALCDFYLPKQSSQAQLLEAKTGLQRRLVEIPLTDEQRAAVEHHHNAVDHLLGRLIDTPTPAGRTPRQLGAIDNHASGEARDDERMTAGSQSRPGTGGLLRSVGARRAMALEQLGHPLELDPELRQQRHRVAVLADREQHVREFDMRATALDRQLRGGDKQTAQLPGRAERFPHTERWLVDLGHPPPPLGHDAQHLAPHASCRDAHSFEQPDRAARLGRQQSKQDVLRLDPGVTEDLGLHQRALQHALPLDAERQRAVARLLATRITDQQLPAYHFVADPEVFQHPRPNAESLAEHPVQQMLGTDRSMAQPPCRVARLNDDLASAITEQLKDRASIAHRTSAPPATGPAEKPIGCLIREPGRFADAQCRRPSTGTASRSQAPFPSPTGSVSRPAAGRRFGLCQPPDPARREPKMSASAPAVNSVTLVGNLTTDPVLKQLDENRKVCQLRLAVNDQHDQPPMFIDVATFGAQADACAKYLAKGRAVAVTGRLVYREWEADDGTRRSRHHVVGRVQFGARPDNNGDQPSDDATEDAADF